MAARQAPSSGMSSVTNRMAGPLGLRSFNASASKNAGLTVCKNMVWDNDPFAIVLFYGASSGNIEMLTHGGLDTAWAFKHTFANTTADSGCECTSRGSSRTDLWLFSSNNVLEQHTIELDLKSNSTIYPPSTWVKGKFSPSNIELWLNVHRCHLRR